MEERSVYPRQPDPGPGNPPLVYVADEPAWEYTRVVRHMGETGAPTGEELTELGEQGWELAGILSQAQFVYFYFKRRKR